MLPQKVLPHTQNIAGAEECWQAGLGCSLTTKDSLNCVDPILSIHFSAAVTFGNTN